MDIDPEQASICATGAKVCSRGEVVETEAEAPARPCAATASWTRDCQSSLATSQSKLLTCRSSRFGTSRGSRILAKERRLVLLVELPEVRDAAKRVGPSRAPGDQPGPTCFSAAHAHSTCCHGHRARAGI